MNNNDEYKIFKKKYFKYKIKYLELKKNIIMFGGSHLSKIKWFNFDFLNEIIDEKYDVESFNNIFEAYDALIESLNIYKSVHTESDFSNIIDILTQLKNFEKSIESVCDTTTKYLVDSYAHDEYNKAIQIFGLETVLAFVDTMLEETRNTMEGLAVSADGAPMMTLADKSPTTFEDDPPTVFPQELLNTGMPIVSIGSGKALLEKNFVWKRDVYFIDPCYIPGLVDRQTMMVLKYYKNCIINDIPHYLNDEWSTYLYYFQDVTDETEPSPDSCFLYTDDFVHIHPELIGNCCLLLNWCEPLSEDYLHPLWTVDGVKPDKKQIAQYYYDLYAINQLSPKYILAIFESDDYSLTTDDYEDEYSGGMRKNHFRAGTYLFHKWRLNEMKEIYDVIKEQKNEYSNEDIFENYSCRIMLMRKK